MSSKIKTQIRLNRVYQRLEKTTYKGLSASELKIIKTIERLERRKKDFNDFFVFAPRVCGVNSPVDWKKISEEELEMFEFMKRSIAALDRSLNRFSDAETKKAVLIFKKINQRISTSY